VKILAFPSPSNARQYRLDQLGHYFGLQSQNNFYVSEGEMNENDLSIADVVILQQTTSPEKIKMAREVTRKNNSLLVAEVDDAFGVNPDNPFKERHERLDAKKWLEVLCGVADVVTTTTDYLAGLIKRKLKENNVKKDVVVLPNYLNMEDWHKPLLRNYSDEIRLLWAGSCSHRDDMKFIAPVIKRICEKYPQVKFIHCGDVKLIPLFKDINSEYVDAVPYRTWPSKLHSFRADIAVAPLIDTEFNRCKSNLKYLEYGISGYAGVYSNIVYPETVQDGKTGLIAKNQDEFFEKISLLIENKELREIIAAGAFFDVRENYDVKNHAMKWINTYWYHLSKIRKLKIDVGSGIQPILGGDYVHLDISPRFGEIVVDVLNGIPVADSSVTNLRCSAIVEHFYLHDLREKVLPEFYRILTDGGRLYIVVPDWQKIKESDKWEMVQQNLYGAYHKYILPEHDLHKYCWDFKHLKKELEKFGFKQIKKIKYTDRAHDPKFTLALEAFK